MTNCRLQSPLAICCLTSGLESFLISQGRDGTAGCLLATHVFVFAGKKSVSEKLSSIEKISAASLIGNETSQIYPGVARLNDTKIAIMGGLNKRNKFCGEDY